MYVAGKRGLTRFIIVTNGARGINHWAVSERFATTSGDPCDVDTATNWSVSNLDGEPPIAVLATPEPALPLINVAYSATWSGRTSVVTSHHLIFDMRSGPPRLAARLSSHDVEVSALLPSNGQRRIAIGTPGTAIFCAQSHCTTHDAACG
jgi:hypothetical protein